MQGPASLTVLRRTDQTCVWMDAGVLGFKLCDRDFDCRHCPLNAALQGESIQPEVARPPVPGRCTGFPADRVYSGGHTWVSRTDGDHGLLRFGLDAFGASLAAQLRRLRRATPVFRTLERGETLCELDLPGGVLPITTPIGGRVWAWNDALAESPHTLACDPYGSGWIAELEPDPGESPGDLLGSVQALREARLDAGRFCRGAALHLLAEPALAAGLSSDGVCGVTDLRVVLGPSVFVALVRDLVH